MVCRSPPEKRAGYLLNLFLFLRQELFKIRSHVFLLFFYISPFIALNPQAERSVAQC